MIALGVSILLLILIFKDVRELFRSKNKFSFRDLNHSNFKIIIQYLILIVGVVFVSVSFSIPWYLIMYLLFFSLLGFALLVFWMKQFDGNIHNFNQFILILSHLSAQFKSSFKILSSLEEVLLVVDESHRPLIEGLIVDCYEGRDMLKSFSKFSDHYLLHSMLSMMVYAEQYGDEELERGLSMLERDVDDLNEDVHNFVVQMHQFSRKLILLCVIGIGIALVSRNMLRMVAEIDLSVYYQNTAFIFLLVMIMVLVFSHQIFRHQLLMEEESL